jgi:hypothetical protein
MSIAKFVPHFCFSVVASDARKKAQTVRKYLHNVTVKRKSLTERSE